MIFVTIVAIGDSITAGYNCAHKKCTCSFLSYIDFMIKSLEKNGFVIDLYNMGISGAQAGNGCAGFNQSYKNGGQTPAGAHIDCWDLVLNNKYKSSPYFLYMLGTNDAIQKYVNACFDRNTDAATNSYFQSVLSMLTEIRIRFPDSYIILLRPLKSYTDQTYLYDD